MPLTLKYVALLHYATDLDTEVALAAACRRRPRRVRLVEDSRHRHLHLHRPPAVAHASRVVVVVVVAAVVVAVAAAAVVVAAAVTAVRQSLCLNKGSALISQEAARAPKPGALTFSITPQRLSDSLIVVVAATSG